MDAATKAELAKPAELTFWTWVEGLQPNVDLFQKKYPNIKVKIQNQGQGQPHYAKLRSAMKSGQGAPDVAQIEFQYVPTFSLTNDLLDITKYTAATKALYPEPVWNQVVRDGKVYAVPQDIGPMAMLYREDIFKKNNIEIPKTWAEFAEAGKKLHAADPKTFITSFAPNDGGWINGMLWQAGAKPFTVKSADSIDIHLADDPAAKKFIDVWSPMIKDGTVAVDPDFADDWYRGLNEGKYATWITAGWGPYFLQGQAKSTSGKWRAAPIPQYAAGENASANWGGSTTAVMAKSKFPVAAAEFAKFLNSDPESAKLMVTNQHFFPATSALLSSADFTDAKDPFFGDTPVNKTFAEAAAQVNPDFTFSPFQDTVYSTQNDTIGAAVTKRQDLGPAFDAWQKAVTDFAKKQGFKVGG
ncbi:MAG: extracellular solute-binding protein [Actinomycetota bacterium]